MSASAPIADSFLRILSDAALAKLAAHEVPVARLAELWDPYACWPEQATPIRRAEIQACLDAGEEALTETPSWTQVLYGPPAQRISASENRQRHIRKIAYFVRQVATDPISLDVGVPSLGCASDELVGDGNHRLAAAMFRGDATIRAHVSGSVHAAQDLGLWHPNAAEREQERRYRQVAPTAPQVETPAPRRRMRAGR